MNQDQAREMLTLLRSIERLLTRIDQRESIMRPAWVEQPLAALRDQQPVKVWVGDDGKIYAQELA